MEKYKAINNERLCVLAECERFEYTSEIIILSNKWMNFSSHDNVNSLKEIMELFKAILFKYSPTPLSARTYVIA
jgi:hypothetical protein